MVSLPLSCQSPSLHLSTHSPHSPSSLPFSGTFLQVPSTVWPVTPEEKEGILSGYKTKLGEIHCRHFARGAGTCPFGEDQLLLWVMTIDQLWCKSVVVRVSP